MDQSEGQNRIIEYLRIKPISHTQIYTTQIAIPESDRGEIPQERRETLRRSLVEQGSNLFPLIVRPTEAYSNEEEYEVIYGADWCIVAKELGIEQLWAWIFEMTDEETVTAKAEMELLTPPSISTAFPINTLWQQLEVSFQERVDTLTKKLEQSIKKNEDFLKKQVKALSERNVDTTSLEQIKNLLAQIEKTFHNKGDHLAKTLEKSGQSFPPPAPLISEENLAGALRQLEELEKLLERKLERTGNAIHQYVTDSLQSLEDDLRVQINALRRELQSPEKPQRKAQSETVSTPAPTPASKSKSKPQTKTQSSKGSSKAQAATDSQDYESLSLRKLKLIGKERKLRGYARMKRPEILAALKKADSGR